MLEEACLPDLDKVSGHVELQLRKLFDARIDDLFGIKVVADPYCPDNLVKFFDGKGRPSLTLYIEDDQTPRQD